MSVALGGWILAGLGVVLAFTGARWLWLTGAITGAAAGWLVITWLLPDLGAAVSVLGVTILAVVVGYATRRNPQAMAPAIAAVLVGLLGLALLEAWAQGNLLWQCAGFVLGAVVGTLVVRTSHEGAVPLVTGIGGGGLVWTGILQAFPSAPRWFPVITAIVVGVFGYVAQMSMAGSPESPDSPDSPDSSGSPGAARRPGQRGPDTE